MGHSSEFPSEADPDKRPLSKDEALQPIVLSQIIATLHMSTVPLKKTVPSGIAKTR